MMGIRLYLIAVEQKIIMLEEQLGVNELLFLGGGVVIHEAEKKWHGGGFRH